MYDWIKKISTIEVMFTIFGSVGLDEWRTAQIFYHKSWRKISFNPEVTILQALR